MGSNGKLVLGSGLLGFGVLDINMLVDWNSPPSTVLMTEFSDLAAGESSPGLAERDSFLDFSPSPTSSDVLLCLGSAITKEKQLNKQIRT